MRETDIAIALALGAEKVVTKEEAIRLSNEDNERRGPSQIGNVMIVRQPWDDWYAHDLYIVPKGEFPQTGLTDLPRYSTFETAALELLEEATNRGWGWDTGWRREGYHCKFWATNLGVPDFIGRAEDKSSLAEAIACAFLRTIGFTHG